MPKLAGVSLGCCFKVSAYSAPFSFIICLWFQDAYDPRCAVPLCISRRAVFPDASGRAHDVTLEIQVAHLFQATHMRASYLDTRTPAFTSACAAPRITSCICCCPSSLLSVLPQSASRTNWLSLSEFASQPRFLLALAIWSDGQMQGSALVCVKYIYTVRRNGPHDKKLVDIQDPVRSRNGHRITAVTSGRKQTSTEQKYSVVAFAAGSYAHALR